MIRAAEHEPFRRRPYDRLGELVAAGRALAGFFIISASSQEDAVSVARGSPHVRHGGTIVVRPLPSSPLVTNLNTIIGGGGTGKSTILEAIAWAIYGASAARGPCGTTRHARQRREESGLTWTPTTTSRSSTSAPRR